MNRERIEETVRLWQAEPDKAKGKPTVIARAEGSKAVMEHGSFSWRTDMPVPLGGTNEAPSPTALLLSALAGCAVVFIRDTLAPQFGVTVDAIEATAQCETDARGLMGMNGIAPDVRNVGLSIAIRSLGTSMQFRVSTKPGRSAVRSIWRSPKRSLWRRRSTSSGPRSQACGQSRQRDPS
jgi:hypothetical protein